MSDTATTTDSGDLERRFRELVADLAALGELLRGPSPFAIPATGLIPNVLDGQIIESAWGNAIRDRSLQKFDSLAALKAGWTSPPDGSHAYLLDENSLLLAKAGTWRWLTKVFPAAVGNTAWITWAALATAASSAAQLSISGRWVTLWASAVLATPATASSGTLATIAAPYRLPGGAPRSDCPAVGATSTGAGVGRAYVDSGGIMGHQFTGAPANMTTIILATTWATADLVVA